MRPSSSRRTIIAVGVAAAFVSATAFVRTPGAGARPSVRPLPESTTSAAFNADTLTGRSGKLLMRLIDRAGDGGVAILRRLFGDTAVTHPGVYVTFDSATRRPFSFVTLVPFAEKVKGTIGTYRMGFWPGERRATRSEAYQNPEGFVEVTPENEDTPVSEHFRLRDFLTHDQAAVWPKYLVLSETLVDKLELAIAELQRRGIRADHLAVLSGFRSPQYNARGVKRGGRAADSRHQYGDAADVFVDGNGDGRMDDLNHDGRVNGRDARILKQVFESVEREYPDLTGGLAIYAATRAHGPFVHVDTRGVPARWGLR